MASPDHASGSTDTASLTEGLSAAEAARRLQSDGPNALAQGQRTGWRSIAREMLTEPMFMLLLAAGVLYLLLGELREGLVLFGMVLVVLALTLYQEGKTEHALQSLRDLSAPVARVLRDGLSANIAAHEVVVGDVLVLSEGDRISADAHLLESADLQVDESLLTGESVPVEKHCNASPDSAGLLFSGTLVVRGHGLARVTATGARSQMGRIGEALDQLVVARSPLKRQTASLVQTLAILAFCASVLLVLAYGLMRGDWLGAVLAGIALAMALLPQEFTVVLTVLPALGAWRLSKQQVLTRHMNAIETLGSTTVLCVDKTGTLTENRMTVARLYAQSGGAGQTVAEHVLDIDYRAAADLPEDFHTLVEYSILASMAEPFDPMEKAFHRLGQHFLQGTEHLHRDWILEREYGLTPQLRAMSHVWRAVDGEAHVVAAKGAPEAIVDLCHLDAAQQSRIATAVDAMARQGLRVLGVASARFDAALARAGGLPPVEHDFDFEFVGLLGLADPLRAEIPQAMAQCRSAGIRVVMITGDYPQTAVAIAQQAGMQVRPEQDVLTGEMITALDDAALQQRLRQTSVCARVAPTQKLRIVQALKANAEVVAMTGDGVNDAPALKAAHVGIAMGQRGTDVAREAASLVLLDDNFASIVGAVRLGRRIFDNLRKSMTYILAVHIPIAGVALLPVLLGWPVLLMPLHIVFMELVIDPACSLVFENEPDAQDAMNHPPRDANAPLFGGMALLTALFQGLGVLAAAVWAYQWGHTRLGEEATRSLVFVALVAGNLALLLANRSHRLPFWKTLTIPNRTLWLVCAATLGMLMLSLSVPFLRSLFAFAPLDAATLLLGLGTGLASLVWFEVLRRLSSFAESVRGRV